MPNDNGAGLAPGPAGRPGMGGPGQSGWNSAQFSKRFDGGGGRGGDYQHEQQQMTSANQVRTLRSMPISRMRCRTVMSNPILTMCLFLSLSLFLLHRYDLLHHMLHGCSISRSQITGASSSDFTSCSTSRRSERTRRHVCCFESAVATDSGANGKVRTDAW